MNFSKVFILFLLLLLPGCGCKDSEIITVLLSEEFKRYTDFPAGSWWVYEKIDEPEVTDSIYIYRNIQVIKSQRDECEDYEKLVLNAVRINSGMVDTIIYEIFPRPPIDPGNPKYYLFYIVIAKGIWNQDLLFFPNEIGEKSEFQSNFEIIEKAQDIIVNGNKYTETITTFHLFEKFVISETYAQDVGVIRRVYRDSSIYELKSYFINK